MTPRPPARRRRCPLWILPLVVVGCSGPEAVAPRRSAPSAVVQPGAWEELVASIDAEPTRREPGVYVVRVASALPLRRDAARARAREAALSEAAHVRATSVSSVSELRMTDDDSEFTSSLRVSASTPFADYAEVVLGEDGDEARGYRVALELRIPEEQVLPWVALEGAFARGTAGAEELRAFARRAEVRGDSAAREAALRCLLELDPRPEDVHTLAGILQGQRGVNAALHTYRAWNGRFEGSFEATIEDLRHALPGVRPPAEPHELSVLGDEDAYRALSRDGVAALLEAAESFWPASLAETLTRVGLVRFTAAGAAHWIGVYRHRRTGLEFVLVPGEAGSAGLDPFLVCRTECSQAAWSRGSSTNPTPNVWRADALPVTGVTWTAATAWCDAHDFQLPTERQWEHAARAGATLDYAFGAELAPSDANLGRDLLATQTGRWNAFGLRAVHGNAQEWCRDAWLVDLAGGRDDGSGSGEVRGGEAGLRAVRGGGIGLSARRAGFAHRTSCPPDAARPNLGFRPVVRLRLQ